MTFNIFMRIVHCLAFRLCAASKNGNIQTQESRLAYLK
jgi:hypothetical protein